MAARAGGKKGPPRKKAGGYKMPPPMPAGELLTDAPNKKKWRIGPSIGVGGFGEIYSACDDAAPPKSTNSYPYVVKIEPHENGPLFVEKHFYSRNANRDDKVVKEWTDELCIRLIEVYKEYPALWNPNDNGYKMISKKIEAWKKIGDRMNINVNELKKKMASLTASYRKVNHRVKKRKQSSGQEDEYVPTWFAYKHFEFLSAKYQDKQAAEEPSSEQDEDDKDDDEEERDEEEEKTVRDDETEDSSNSESSYDSDSASQQSQNEQEGSAAKTTTSLKRKRATADEIFDNAYKCLKKVSEYKGDEFDIYGQYVANILRNLDRPSTCCLQKVFADAIFHAQMGKFLLNEPFASTTFIPHDTNIPQAATTQVVKSSPQTTTPSPQNALSPHGSPQNYESAPLHHRQNTDDSLNSARDASWVNENGSASAESD